MPSATEFLKGGGKPSASEFLNVDPDFSGSYADALADADTEYRDKVRSAIAAERKKVEGERVGGKLLETASDLAQRALYTIGSVGTAVPILGDFVVRPMMERQGAPAPPSLSSHIAPALKEDIDTIQKFGSEALNLPAVRETMGMSPVTAPSPIVEGLKGGAADVGAGAIEGGAIFAPIGAVPAAVRGTVAKTFVPEAEKVFIGQMTAGMPSAAEQLTEAVRQGDWEGATRAATGLAGSALLIKQMGSRLGPELPAAPYMQRGAPEFGAAPGPVTGVPIGDMSGLRPEGYEQFQVPLRPGWRRFDPEQDITTALNLPAGKRLEPSFDDQLREAMRLSKHGTPEEQALANERLKVLLLGQEREFETQGKLQHRKKPVQQPEQPPYETQEPVAEPTTTQQPGFLQTAEDKLAERREPSFDQGFEKTAEDKLKERPEPPPSLQPALDFIQQNPTWKLNAAPQLGSVSLKGLSAEQVAQLRAAFGRRGDLEFTNDSGITFYVPEGASLEDIRKTGQAKVDEFRAKEPTNPIPDIFREPPPEPPAAPGAVPVPKTPKPPTTPTGAKVNPAIKLMNGKVVSGKAGQTHNDIITENKIPATDIDQRGFTDESSNFLTREQAAAVRPELPTNVEAGKLHSTDLPEAKGVATAAAAAAPAPAKPTWRMIYPSKHALVINKLEWTIERSFDGKWRVKDPSGKIVSERGTMQDAKDVVENWGKRVEPSPDQAAELKAAEDKARIAAEKRAAAEANKKPEPPPAELDSEMWRLQTDVNSRKYLQRVTLEDLSSLAKGKQTPEVRALAQKAKNALETYTAELAAAQDKLDAFYKAHPELRPKKQAPKVESPKAAAEAAPAEPSKPVAPEPPITMETAEPPPPPEPPRPPLKLKKNEMVVIDNPKTGKSTVASYQGKTEAGRIKVKVGTLQYTVDDAWIRRPGEKRAQPRPDPLEKEYQRAAQYVDDLQLQPTTSKGAVVRYAEKLKKAGLIDALTLKEVQRLAKDRDMGVDDLTSEIQSSMQQGRDQRMRARIVTDKVTNPENVGQAFKKIRYVIDSEFPDASAHIGIVNSWGELPAEVRQRMGKDFGEGEGLAAAYDTATGQVWFNASHPVFGRLDAAGITDMLVHEVAIHKGLRLALGQKRFDQMANQIYESLTENERQDLIKSGYAPNRSIIGEEWLAHVAEAVSRSTKPPGIWNKIVNVFRQLYRDFTGKSLRFSDSEIAHLIERGRKAAADESRETFSRTGAPISSRTLTPEQMTRARELQATDGFRVAPEEGFRGALRPEDIPDPILRAGRKGAALIRGLEWRWDNPKALDDMALARGAGVNEAAITAQNLGNAVGNQLIADLKGTTKGPAPVISADWWKKVSMPTVNVNRLANEALTFVVEAGNDLGKLQQDRQFLANAPEPSGRSWLDLGLWRRARARAVKAMDYAINNFAKFDNAAKLYKTVTDSQWQRETQAGLETPKHENYVFHAQDVEGDIDLGIFSESRGGEGTAFKKERTHPNYVSSIAAGVLPRSMDAIDLLKNRLNLGERKLTNNLWMQQVLPNLKDANGRPLALKISPKKVGVGGPWERMEWDVPAGYEHVNFAGNDLAVAKGFANYFRALTEPSRFQQSPALNAILSVAHTGKHAMLMIDTFHLMRLGFWASMIQKAPPNARRGLLLLDNTVGDLRAMAARGDIPQSYLKDAIYHKHLVENVMIPTGFNISGVSDNLYSALTQHVPIAGAFNKYLFNEFQRGAMTSSWLSEFKRRYEPGMNEMELGREISRDLNRRFGTLNEQSLIKSKTFRDLSRLVFLAPGWNEGLIMSELVGLKQLAVDMPKDLVMKQKLAVGTLGSALAKSALFLFVANQIINQATRGKFTWENPEDGTDAKLSAYIPDVTGTSPGVFFSPQALPLETIHLLTKNAERSPDFKSAVRKYISSRFSYLARPAYTYLTGKDVFDRPIAPEKLGGEIAKQLIPAPIPAKSVYLFGKEIAGRALAKARGEEYRGTRQEFGGQYERQALASMGMKTSAVPTDTARIYKLAEDFNKNRGVTPQAEFYDSDFNNLNRYLRIGNDQAAREEMAKLLEKKTEREISQHYHRRQAPFTKNRNYEREFYTSLTPDQKRAYEKAREDHAEINARAIDLFNEVVNERDKNATAQR